jgi:iron complex outermembrane receptor protein
MPNWFYGGSQSSTAQSQDAVTPRVGLLWKAQNWLSLYTNYAESFGMNQGLLYPGKTPPPTSAEQYEGGVKTEFFDGRLRATLAYYDLTKTNVMTTDMAHLGFSISTGAVRSRGPELDIIGEILPGWNVIANYANTDARVVKSNDGGIQAVGTRFYGVPRNMASLWNTFEPQNTLLKGVKVGGGVTIRDGQTTCCDTPSVNLPGYATVDMLAAYSLKVGKSKLSLQLNVNNLLDKNYFTNGQITAGNYGNVIFGTPRTFMGSIGIQY